MIEAIILSRREQISGVDARNARPLSADNGAELAPFLAANQEVIIDERIRKLAAEIVGSEKNPVRACRAQTLRLAVGEHRRHQRYFADMILGS